MDIMGICARSSDDVTIGNGVEDLRKHAFSVLLQCCQATGGLTGHGGGQTGQALFGFLEWWRAVRPAEVAVGPAGGLTGLWLAVRPAMLFV